MPNAPCRRCGKPFYTKPAWTKLGHGIYCSQECQYAARRIGRVEACFTCGKESYKSPKELRVSKSQKFFCSRSCQTKWRNVLFSGSNHANWKGGASVEYREIMKKLKVPARCRLCKTKDIRVLCVHHLDENRINNRVSNLVWLCYNCHHLVHIHKVPVKK